uniref:PS II complex 12 kDa extrinsic protein n=1 Tax=Fibrocapsa japonica TaxID=94617 RepID=A0A7S2V2P5_9STRA|mmetsp:Transcript_21817/g.31661  ORF Transcript_21817/g.31661 Transcript_21817/m.31661 type:complete len:144 (+) Transcript_21817:89-520(+)|eukprot:CAMPEP_0113934548 /NCGR_PEP_ID=MMETSP1339-20121228/1866_1 /TAXON_ID=94617 /ORGANISM="Fibrocapsa japonica" /LENGTH=143 /DNA_ID=CAMNT_0000936405 /DNA_START=84 /DNA_END=515 /DNA_ORIENTATION=- /assembly_acc=CAM_ASM_000762
MAILYKAIILALVALIGVNAFAPVPLAQTARSTSLNMGGASVGGSDEEFVPSETWLADYLGENGLRYAMNKTPQELETEGDYPLLDRLFGQTSNNGARLELKKVARAKANSLTAEQEEEKQSWLSKFGYGRFFPAYVDKSGEN